MRFVIVLIKFLCMYVCMYVSVIKPKNAVINNNRDVWNLNLSFVFKKTFISIFFCCSVFQWPILFVSFYRVMHFSAKRGIAIACRLSVRLSVHPSVTLVNCDHIGWKSSKIISPSVSFGRSLFATQTSRVYSKGNTLKFSPE